MHVYLFLSLSITGHPMCDFVSTVKWCSRMKRIEKRRKIFNRLLSRSSVTSGCRKNAPLFGIIRFLGMISPLRIDFNYCSVERFI